MRQASFPVYTSCMLGRPMLSRMGIGGRFTYVQNSVPLTVCVELSRGDYILPAANDFMCETPLKIADLFHSVDDISRALGTGAEVALFQCLDNGEGDEVLMIGFGPHVHSSFANINERLNELKGNRNLLFAPERGDGFFWLLLDDFVHGETYTLTRSQRFSRKQTCS